MSYVIREIAGWIILVLGLVIFALVYNLLLNKRVFEAGPLVVIGFIVFRGGIHLLKVATAARAALAEPRSEASASRRGVRIPAPVTGVSPARGVMPGPRHDVEKRSP